MHQSFKWALDILQKRNTNVTVQDVFACYHSQYLCRYYKRFGPPHGFCCAGICISKTRNKHRHIYYLRKYANIDKHDQRYIHSLDINSFYDTTLTKDKCRQPACLLIESVYPLVKTVFLHSRFTAFFIVQREKQTNFPCTESFLQKDFLHNCRWF